MKRMPFLQKIGSVMKKTVLIIVLSLAVLSALSAATVSINAAIGVPSSVGISCSFSSFEVDAGVDTTYGVGGLLTYSLLDRFITTDMSGWDRFTYGNRLIHGLSVSAFWKAVDTDVFDFLLGLDVTALHASSREGVVSHFTRGDLLLFNLMTKMSFSFDSHNSLFFSSGFPFLVYINYGGDESNLNYAPFDFWALCPKALFEVEEGNYIDVKASQLALVFAALNFRIGYSYRF